MAASITCPHCNGTTFCGGFQRNGALMTSQACASCLAKSNLPVKGQFYKVVCSVCGGTGTVTEKPSRQQGYSQMVWLLISSPLLLLAGFMSAMAIQQYRAHEEEIEFQRETVAEQIREAGRNTPLPLVKNQILGRTKEQVKMRLGEPERMQKLPSQEGPSFELWFYTRNDGRLKVRFEENVVKEASLY